MKRTVSFSKNSTNIFFHITTKCNLSCKHCYINPKQHGDRMLSLSTISSWLSLFFRPGRPVNVIFLGGEPTLHPDLPAAIRTAGSLGAHSITVDTNGYLFHDILSRVSPKEVDFFSFSLDGATRETNDRIRGAGCYDVCISGIRRAVSKGFSTSLIYTVSRDNIYELPKMVPVVSDLGIDRFFIQVIGLRGESVKAGRKEMLQASRSEWLAVIPKTAKEIAELGVTATYPKVFLEPSERFECAGIVAENYFIFPNGRVYRCPLCEDYPLHSLMIADNRLIETEKINESQLFELTIPEGCVMNRIIQPENLIYKKDGAPAYRVACCMLKEEYMLSRNAF